ncbi:MAG: hypothetical protein WD989_02450 [Candidatus Paceibacterota bacterium]
MSSKFLLISLVILLSLMAFGAGYFISRNDFSAQPASIGSDNILNKFNGNQTSKENLSKDFVALSKDSVLSVTLSKEKDSLMYYNQRDGRAFQVNPLDRQEKIISTAPLSNLIETIWSPNKKEVVSVFQTQNGKQFKYFNYQTRKTADFGTLVKSAVFSPDGSRLAYFKSQGLNSAIYISAPDGDAPKKILDTRLVGLEIYWPASPAGEPSQDSLALKTSIDGRDTVFTLSVTGNLAKLIDEDGQVELLWSSDGNQLLYSVKKGSGTALFVRDSASHKQNSLEVSTTASKCAWGLGGEYVICSVPRSGTGGEDIYKIGIDKTKELLASPKKSLIINQLLLTVLDEFIIVLNGMDDKLYALRLK